MAIESLQVGSTYLLSTICADTNQVAINARHWLVTSLTGTTPTTQDFAHGYDNVMAPLYKQLLNNTATYRGTGIRRVSGSTPYGATRYSAGNIGPGTAGAVPLPRQVSGLISLKTDLAGKHFLNRVYIPFPAVDDNDVDATPTGVYVALMAGIANILTAPQVITGVGGGTANVTPVTFKKQTPPAPDLGAEINQYLLHKAWATQRRRGSFGRPNTSPI